MKWNMPYSRDRLTLPKQPILSERLALRGMRESDLPILWLMDSDPEVMRYIHEPRSDQKAFYGEMLEDLRAGIRFKFFRIIADINTDEAIGWLLFRPTENEKWVELGYRLPKHHWGKGYVPEASKAIIKTAVNDWGLDKIMAVLIKENIKSAKVAEKLGFEYQGQTREYYDMDLAFYVLDVEKYR